MLLLPTVIPFPSCEGLMVWHVFYIQIHNSVNGLSPLSKLMFSVRVRTSGPNAGKTMISSYKFDGPDQCHVCFDPAMTTVPNKFGTDPGSGFIWHTWQRVKK